MRTRQQRVSDATRFTAVLSSLVGKSVQVVTTRQEVHFVEVVSIADISLTALNMRREKMSIPLAQISELYFDTIKC